MNKFAFARTSLVQRRAAIFSSWHEGRGFPEAL
ncbi:hypothetical protein SEEGA711_23007 [Salmonella enterica subsp. enterica serovar Gaminara str. ATCC BAA-711]|nr:hypothetical protein SEEGA711_23007 [Salmonella enterica subsp. enterica serovar Gaminara str. ATCC BAA-711]